MATRVEVPVSGRDDERSLDFALSHSSVYPFAACYIPLELRIPLPNSSLYYAVGAHSHSPEHTPD